MFWSFLWLLLTEPCFAFSVHNARLKRSLQLSVSFADLDASADYGSSHCAPDSLDDSHAFEVIPDRRKVIQMCLAYMSLLSPCLAASANDDIQQRSTVVIRLDSPTQRAGLELYETAIGTPPRTVVAVRNVLPNKMNTKVQPGMILLEYTSKQQVMEKLANGPFPLQLKFHNLAAGGDAINDLGQSIVTPQDALKLAQDMSSDESTSKKQNSSGRGLVITATNKPTPCGDMQSRRNDVLEIEYEARYGGWDGPVYDSSESRGTGQPYQFVLGSGDMLPGVDQGLYDACPGEGRRLEIPPVLAYGEKGNKMFQIPGGQTLYWLVRLVRVNSVSEGDGRTRDEIEGRAPYE